MHQIFVLEDDSFYRRMIIHRLSMDPEYELTGFDNADDLFNSLYLAPDVITLDLNMPSVDGVEILKSIKTRAPQTKVIVVSGQEQINRAVEVLKQGAFDYLSKDEDTMERLWISVHKATQNSSMEKELEVLREEVDQKYDLNSWILGSCSKIQQVFKTIEKTLTNDINVVVTGETGTGKELVAKAIHYNSKRKNKSFIPINVSAIPDQLIESELFGYEKGAFTGANSSKPGKFEEATGGTLFLDEIGEMNLQMQAKLLRVIQEMELTRLGSNTIKKLDFRLIIATHNDLLQEVEKGNFREDLYYRLRGLSIELPPLRDRANDYKVLSLHFLNAFTKKNNMNCPKISDDALTELKKYPFPGNVRELKSIIEAAAVVCNGDIIQSEDLNLMEKDILGQLIIQNRTLDQYNAEIVAHHLTKNNNNISKTARELEIGKSTIYRMINKGRLATK
jgi:DNA-binding NtrC family response regulator